MALIPYEALDPYWEMVGYRPSAEQEAVHRALLQPSYGLIDGTEEQGQIPTVVVVGGGEQGGKSKSAGMHCFGRAMLPPQYADELIWLIGVEYKDCKREFDYAVEAGVAIGALKDDDFTGAADGPWEARFRLSGTVLKTLASKDVTNLSREAPNGIIMCEPGRQSEETFETLRRRAGLSNPPGWLLVCGTFEEAARWYPNLFNEGLGDNPYRAVSLSIPTYSNRKRFPGGELDPRFRALVQSTKERNPVDGEAIVLERFYGIPRKTRGIVFWEFTRQHHVRHDARYLPGIEVSLAVDPGYSNAFAVLFIQVAGDQIRIFDEIYVTNTHGRDIIARIKTHRSYPDLTRIVLDVASKQHTNAQDSAYETWRAAFAGDDISVAAQYVAVREGIRRTHDRLQTDVSTGQPYLIVNPACVNTIWEFTEGYRYQVSRTTHEQSGDPIDAGNHAMKAIAYWIVDRFGFTDTRQPVPRRRVVRHSYDVAFARAR